MDALARIEPVARPLLRDVDAALTSLGAPAEHRIWGLLRRVGATPADAVAHVAAVEAEPIRAAARALRAQVEAYRRTEIPAQVPWHGSTGEAYAAHAQALTEHLLGDRDDAMAARLAATASYVEELAVWIDRCRAGLAGALVEVITSAQAVALRTGPGGGEGPAAGAPSQVRSGAVIAAAEIGAYLLAAVAEAADEGRALTDGWSANLAELPFRAVEPSAGIRPDATIRLQH